MNIPHRLVKMERASTPTPSVSVVVLRKVSIPDMREMTKTRSDSLATLAPSSECRLGCLPIPYHEYKLWETFDDPDSVWNALHIERSKLNERKRFSLCRECKKMRNHSMKDNGHVFKKCVKQSFARREMEVLGVD